MKILWI